MSIDGFDDSDFQDIAITGSKAARADIVMSVITAGRHTTKKMQFNVASAVLAEIGLTEPRARLGVAWSIGKSAFRLKAEKNGSYEVLTPPNGDKSGRALVRVPLPPGLVDAAGKADPEFYVDTIGKLIIVECPDLFLRPAMKMLPAPARADKEPTREAPRYPGSAVDDDIVMRAALGGSAVPLHIDGQKFSTSEAQIVALLAHRGLVTKQACLLATIDPAQADTDDREEKIIDVFMCKIRPKLRAMGIEVESIWGQGWKLSQASRSKLKNLIQLARMELEA